VVWGFKIWAAKFIPHPYAQTLKNSAISYLAFSNLDMLYSS
jgi:hypothetical protein